MGNLEIWLGIEEEAGMGFLQARLLLKQTGSCTGEHIQTTNCGEAGGSVER